MLVYVFISCRASCWQGGGRGSRGLYISMLCIRMFGWSQIKHICSSHRTYFFSVASMSCVHCYAAGGDWNGTVQGWIYAQDSGMREVGRTKYRLQSRL